MAYVLTADRHAAEDLLQNALIKAAAHWGRIHSSPEAHVRRIMYREQVSLWRWRARRLTQRGMTVTRVKSAAVAKQPGGGGYLILVRFLPGDAAPFAALTSKLVGLPSPHCQLAVMVGGRVISAPSVDAEIVARDQVQIVGFTSRAQVENLLGRG